MGQIAAAFYCLGYRQQANDSLQALAQGIILIKTRDSGASAEPELSGSKTVFLIAGLSHALTHGV